MAEGPPVADKKTRVLVLGASGMLGNATLRCFAESADFVAWGSVRSASASQLLPPAARERVICDVDVMKTDNLIRLFAQTAPDIVINCIGVVKQLAEADDPLTAIPINAQLPHRLARLCQVRCARLVHISTDCVFAGNKGMYHENDDADARDLYGRTKFLGEVDYPDAVTLRTSIIGHELNSDHGLLAWFLAQTGAVKGFVRARFSGVPTIELARIVRDYVLPRPELRGVYHVSAAPISKYELLRLIAQAYGRTKDIVPDGNVVIDRSLDSTRFRQATGYMPPTWPELVRTMRDFG